MKRFRVYTTWGAAFGIQVDVALEQLVERTKRNGYICTPHIYVMFGAIVGIEDEELMQAMQDAQEEENWH